MKRFLRLTLVVMVFWCAASAHTQPTVAPARLAILSAVPALGAANDVLTAALSKHEGLVLLERAQIEKVYREQQLSAANQDLVKLGHILGANGLVILQTVNEGTNQFLQARLIAVNPGVVLAEFRSPWPLKDPVQWSDIVTADFSPLFPKLTVLPKDAVPLSILNLRSSLRTAANQEMERELTVLLIHRLTHERDVFVLERQHLSDALAEKEFAADDSPFWTGRYLLDGIIDKDGFDPVTATISARLALAQGGETVPIEVSGPRANLNALAELLVGKVLAVLHRSSSVAGWNPAREADQFFGEAQWAYRWKLLPEAAAAAESAWALGRRDRAEAELRINSYRAQVPGQTTNLTIKPLPPAIRAQELFCQDWRLINTNAFAPDLPWYDLGLGVVAAGDAALEFYNQNVELRPGHEDELARLRSLVRQTAALLQTNDARPSEQPDSWTFHASTPNIRVLEWRKAWYWAEKPEDALVVFRGLLEKGVHPNKSPELAAWSWADRRRVPGLLKQWLGEVAHDTNMEVRLEGQILSLLRAPDDGSGLREELEKEYQATIWENRRWILDKETNLWPFQQFELLVVNQVSGGDLHFDFDSFTALEHRLRMDFLANPSSAKEDVFAVLFYAGTPPEYFRPAANQPGVSINLNNGYLPLFNITLSNAMELLPLMEKFQPQWLMASLRDRTIKGLRNAAGLSPLQSNPPPPAKPVAPPEEPIEAPFTDWNFRGFGSDDEWKPQLVQGISHAQRILFEFNYMGQSILLNQDTRRRTSFVSVDAKTGVSQEIAFPTTIPFPFSVNDRAFDFSSNSLFVGDKDKIYRYRFDRAEWEPIPVPMERAMQLVVLNGRVYISTAVNLLEMDPDSRVVRVLASSRRLPPENEMDTNWDQSVRIYGRADGKLGAAFGDSASMDFEWDESGRSYRRAYLRPGAVLDILGSIDFDPETGGWRHLIRMPMPRPEPIRILGPEMVYSPAGALALLSGLPSVPHRLLAFWNDEATSASLLADTKWEDREKDTNLTERALMDPAPQWAWPREFDLDASLFLCEGKSLWILNPRKVGPGAGTGSSEYEAAQFSDDRQATLFHFVPEMSVPYSVPIRFQSSKPAFDPHLKLLWLDTPENLVLAAPNVRGHWRIPKSSLAARFSAQKESLNEKARMAASQTNRPAGTNAVQP